MFVCSQGYFFKNVLSYTLYHSLLLYFNSVPVVLAQIGPPVEPNADFLPAFVQLSQYHQIGRYYGDQSCITTAYFSSHYSLR